MRSLTASLDKKKNSETSLDTYNKWMDWKMVTICFTIGRSRCTTNAQLYLCKDNIQGKASNHIVCIVLEWRKYFMESKTEKVVFVDYNLFIL